MKPTFLAFLLVLSMASVTVRAADTEADDVTSTSLETEEGSSKRLNAAVEFRPSWTVKEDKLHTENSFEFWYHFTSTREVRFIQYFNTNLLALKGNTNDGFGFELQPAYLTFKMKKLYENGKAGTSLDYEPTLLLPTWKTDRLAGKIGELRNYVKFEKDFGDTFYLKFYEIPVIFAYNRAGSDVEDDGAAANPLLENRVYLVAGFNITKKLNFEFPIWFIATRYSKYEDGAKHNDSWGVNVMVWPELDYTVNENLMLGVSYYSDNFVKSDLSSFTWNNGIQKGAAQLVIRAML